MTKDFFKNRIKTLVRTHNTYNKAKHTAACKDYRTALENTVAAARKNGFEFTYTTTKAGYIHLA